MALKGIFFDLDNTLYDYDAADTIATQALYQEFQKTTPMSFDEFKHLYGQAKNEIKRELGDAAASHNRVLYLQRLIEKVHKTFTSERILTLYHTYWNTLLANAKMFDGAIDFFKFLQSKGIKIAVVTNLTAYIQILKINNLGISDYVDYVVTSEESGFDKPHPSSFLLALHRGHFLPEEVLMVGDSPDGDIEGANALEIPTVWYKFGKNVETANIEGLRTATHTVVSYKELQTLVEGLATA